MKNKVVNHFKIFYRGTPIKDLANLAISLNVERGITEKKYFALLHISDVAAQL